MRFTCPCVLAVVLAVGASAQEQLAHSLNDSAWVAANAATSEWTRDEMRGAVSDDIPGVSDVELARWAAEAMSKDIHDLTDGPRSDPGGLPERPRNGRRAIAPYYEPAPHVPPVAEPRWMLKVAVDAVRSLGYTYPAPYNRYETFPTYTDFPHVTVGKVFFHKPGDARRWVCSAASIGGDGVMTAARCLRDARTGAWWTNWVFVPAYRDGVAPYGYWTANHLWLRMPYLDGGNGDNRYDVGGAVLNRQNGLKISQVVGWLGFMWNQPLSDVTAHYAVIGYPDANGFNGQHQFICQAAYAYSGGYSAPNSVGVGCDMSGGANGGPWIRRYGKSAPATNYLNGLSSYRRCYDSACTAKYTHELFSPYFDSNIKALKDCIVNSVPFNPADPAKGCAPGT